MATVNSWWRPISLPWSQVRERFRWVGNVVTASVKASRTSSVPRPFGRCRSIT